MKSEKVYKSFNDSKSIEELQYNMRQHKNDLDNANSELEFYNYLIQASIYKANVINLFEQLEQFKKEINDGLKKIQSLLDQVEKQTLQITNKIECEDLVCDNFFISEYEKIEEAVISFHTENITLKSRLFQYLHSVITT